MKILAALTIFFCSIIAISYASESVLEVVLPGASTAQIFLSEKKSPDIGEDRILAYDDSEIFPIPASAIYVFDADSSLLSSIYHFRSHYSDDVNYIKDYQDIDNFLTSIYGEPTASISKWSENSIINPKTSDLEEIAKALRWGYVTFTSTWEIGSCSISHIIADSYMNICHWLFISPNAPSESRNGLTEFRPSVYRDSHIADILSSELQPPSSYSESALYFSNKVAFNYESDILYNLKSDYTIDDCTIILPISCTIDDYNAVQFSLIAQYGNPTNTIQYWKDDFLNSEEMSDPEVLALAFKSGLVTFYSEWLLSDCKITHSMNNGTFRPHTVAYSSDYHTIDYSDEHYALGITGGKFGPASQYDFRFRTFVDNKSQSHTISAFSVLVEAFNAYGDIIRWYDVGELHRTFTCNSVKIAPGDTYAMPLNYWEFNGFSGASSVRACITRYQTTDGRTVDIPIDKRLWVEIPYVSEFKY